MSKMGISTYQSYCGAQIFEAVGLNQDFINQYFKGTSTNIEGIGTKEIAEEMSRIHQKAFGDDPVLINALDAGGEYAFRIRGEEHMWNPDSIAKLQHATRTNQYETYKEYAQLINDQTKKHKTLRGLFSFKKKTAINLAEVESAKNIVKRFATGAMSLGSISTEAHSTLAIAMNRIGGKSNTGEGGEDKKRFFPIENDSSIAEHLGSEIIESEFKLKAGDSMRSRIKQVASGRFGVTAEYLSTADQIQIKMAQGAKPGEGGQLPGHKVSTYIAKLRFSVPGVGLISPPPHHDIYSIEDLAQLIHDLKNANPQASISVKLVSETGVGTVAAGVAKAKSDHIVIAGHDGGTGASPISSIKHAGTPWELGLAETQQTLVLNQLRGRVVLQVDGQMKTGRDVVMAAILGADEYGIGTSSLLAMGCVMVRQCHANTCPVGVCTQREDLRAKFEGTPEKVVQLFTHIAEEVREIIASLGFESISDVIGRTELLAQVSRGDSALDDLDLNPILVQADAQTKHRGGNRDAARTEVPDTLDAQMVKDTQKVLASGGKMQLSYNIENTQRAIGTRLSSHIVRQFGLTGMKPGQISARLRGSAGQSLGAFATQGLRLDIIGDANDYVGKGLSGGMITVRPSAEASFVASENTIIGNTVLYGATSGLLFAAGQAGERFCVRNSGATGVVEGCGSNGCEYMTGGNAIILGPIGSNFGAGMTGGMAFLYDPEEESLKDFNTETLHITRLQSGHWSDKLLEMIKQHARETNSALAKRLVNDWSMEIRNFWHVVPHEILNTLDNPVRSETVIGKIA